MSIPKDFKCLVTGAGRGNRRAIVGKLHAQGAIVYALSKNPDNLKKLKRRVFKQAIKTALEPIETVDCVINNAGIYEPTEFVTTTTESFDNHFNINLKAVLVVSQIMAKKMIERGKGGSIVNMSSVSAQRPEPGCAIYCCSKAALDMLTKTMAVELGPHKIRVNSVNPGNVDTDMNRPESYANKEELELVDKGFQSILDKTPTGVVWMPMDDIVNTTLFLASNLTSQITGQCLAVDGGIPLSTIVSNLKFCEEFDAAIRKAEKCCDFE
ncbi:L-xylulose reductase, partial [Orchesella cincta]